MPSSRRSRRRGGALVALLSLALAALLIWHAHIPDTHGVMSLVEDVLPWLGVLIVVFALCAWGTRSGLAGLAVLLVAIVWLVRFVPLLAPGGSADAPTLTVVSENVDAGNSDPAATVRALEADHPEVIALQELTAGSTAAADAVLAAHYPYREVVGTVGVWSSLPLSDAEPLSLGLSWKRALRVTIAAPQGPVRLYELHAASVRPGEYTERDTMLGRLRTELEKDSAERVIVAGDFNAASTDRHFSQLLDTVHEAKQSQPGFGFTWPAAFPITRLDHILDRGIPVVSSRVLPGNGSDHRGIEVGFR